MSCKENKRIVDEDILQERARNLHDCVIESMLGDCKIGSIKFHNINNLRILQGTPINLLDGIVAIDRKDGDISHKIKCTPETIDTNIVRDYKVLYSVTNSEGFTEYASRCIEIYKEDPPPPPPPEPEPEKIDPIDIHQPPTYVTTLKMYKTTVQQGFAVGPVTGAYYCCQVYNTSDWKGENFLINRIDKDGEHQYMIVKNGGHGTEIGVEEINGQAYIWSAWNVVDSGGNTTDYKLCRYPFKNGVTKNIYDGDVEKFDKISKGEYCVPTVSHDGKYMLIRRKEDTHNDSLPINKLEVRLLEDVKKGIDKVIGPIIQIGNKEGTDELAHLQGMTLDDNFIYWRSGQNMVGAIYKPRTTVYDWKTGNMVDTVNETCGDPIEGMNEPEGIHVISNNHGRTLLMCQTKDRTVRRRHMIYMVGYGEGATAQLGDGFKKHNLYMDNGVAFPIPLSSNKLSDIRRPGWYYINTEEAKTFIDHPEPTGGGMLFVSPMVTHSEGFYQKYYRRTGEGRNVYEVQRFVDVLNGNISNWGGTEHQVTIWKGSSVKGGTYKLDRPLTDFDRILFIYEFVGGTTSLDQYIDLKYHDIEKGTIVNQQGVNIEDKDGGAVLFYEHQLKFTDPQTFTVLRRVGVNLKTQKAYETESIKISRIVGIR